MADNSKIEWCDATWNPIIGCSKVSPGCANCYAEKMAGRIAAMQGENSPYFHAVAPGPLGPNAKWSGQTVLVEDALTVPMHWRKPRRIFVVSMGDLFHESVPFEWIDRVFAVMALCPQHTFQVLTKRPERMREYIVSRTSAAWLWDYPVGYGREYEGKGFMASVLPNVWLGTTVENQEMADKRGRPMADLSAMGWRTFCSSEPRLGPINWNGWGFLNWLISGGESGPKARPAHPDWFRSDRDWCKLHGAVWMLKQWGEWLPFLDNQTVPFGPYGMPVCLVKPDGRVVRPYCAKDAPGHQMARVGKHVAGRRLDGVEHNGMPHDGETRGSGEGEKRP